MAEDMGIFEVMYNCRAMRRIRPDAVPEEILRRLVDAASQAPTASNAQNTRWIIVRDAEQKRKLADLNREARRVAYGRRPPAHRPGDGAPAAGLAVAHGAPARRPGPHHRVP